MSDDLYGPKLSPPPTSSPLVRGAVVLVTVAVATSLGCSTPTNPGVPVYDAGITIPQDTGNPGANPGVADTGIWYTPDAGPDANALDMGLSPGVRPVPDAGADADNPGDHT